jgi:apolipoprotein N-acyltransferase
MITRAFGLLTLLVAVSGVLTALAFPGFDVGALAWVSVAPLLFALRRTRRLPAAALASVFAWVYAVGVFVWLFSLPSMNVGAFLVMLVIWTLYFVVFALAYRVVAATLGAWTFVGAACLWVAIEYARASMGFLALPWNLLGHTQYRNVAVIQIADLTGVYGVAAVLIAVNQLVSHVPDVVAAVRRRDGDDARIPWARWAPLLVVPVVVLVALSYGWVRLREPLGGGPHLRVAVVQANVVARRNMSPNDQMRHLGTYVGLSRQVAGERPDLIVWPSSSLPGSFDFVPTRMLMSYLAQQTQTHLLVGGAGGDKFAAPRDGVLPYSNSEFLVAPSGRLVGQYNKIHLTPFNEYVPLRGTLTWPTWLTTLRTSYIRGDTYTIFRVGEARLGVPICWEAVFPDVVRRFVADGANILINATNEAAFGPTAGPRQTLAMNVFRAVENRVPVIRAATTGISALITPRGEISARVNDHGRDLFVAGTFVRDVPVGTTRTFYTAHGDIFASVVTAAGALVLLVALAVRSLLPALRARWSPRGPEHVT